MSICRNATWNNNFGLHCKNVFTPRSTQRMRRCLKVEIAKDSDSKADLKNPFVYFVPFVVKRFCRRLTLERI